MTGIFARAFDFVPDTDIVSSQVDAEFNTIFAALNSILSANNKVNLIEDGAVSTAQIGTGVINTSHISPQTIGNTEVSNAAAIAGSKLDTGDGRLVQTTGLAACSSALVLQTTYQDVVGATVTFTPDVACYALVTAVFELQVFVAGASGFVGSMNAQGRLVVDGVGEADLANITLAQIEVGETNPTLYASVAQVYRIPLTAASHTLKLQAKKGDTTYSGTCGTSTNFLYQLVAQ